MARLINSFWPNKLALIMIYTNLRILVYATVAEAARPISIPLFKDTQDDSAHGRVKREPSSGANVKLTCAKRHLNYGYIELGKIGGTQMNRIDDPQRFKVMFDTGSVTTWVPLDTNPFDKKVQNKYIHSKGEPTTYLFTSEYGTVGQTAQSVVAGMFYKDSICIESLCAKNVYIGAASRVQIIREMKFDGIMGMGNFNKTATDEEKLTSREEYSILAEILKQNKLPNMFSFWLHPCGGMLTLGGFDRKYFRGNVNYIPVIPNQRHWIIQGKDAYLRFMDNSHRYNFKFALLDTGHEDILADIGFVECLNSTAKPDNDGIFECSRLKSMPDIIFLFLYHEVRLTPKDYVFEIQGLLTGYCMLAVDALEKGDNTWILGERFMRNTYTVFDADNLMVGFADLEEQKKPKSRRPWL